jgi:hypothetical protein
MSVRRHADASRLTRALELDCCMACGQVCEVTGSFEMPGLSGSERYVRTRCVAGHVFVGPAFALRQAGAT